MINFILEWFKDKKYPIEPMGYRTVYPDTEWYQMTNYPEYIKNLKHSLYDKLH